MNDPISEMTDKDILNACLDIVGYPGCAAPIYPYHNVVGLIIHKLQEWGCGINYPFNEKKWFSYHAGFMKSIEDVSLQVAFLRTAQALGKWEGPKMEEESREDLEERVERLEIYMKSMQSFFQNTSKSDNP